MQNGYSVEDLLAFLSHAADRGLVPAATAQALAVASRNILGMLDEKEQADLREVNLDDATRRFVNKRAKDFSPSSLKEYGNRVQRAVTIFLRWREDPANFSVKTRATKASGKQAKKGTPSAAMEQTPQGRSSEEEPVSSFRGDAGGYRTSLPVRPGVVVTIANLPDDLTKAEAERLSTFIKMLAVH